MDVKAPEIQVCLKRPTCWGLKSNVRFGSKAYIATNPRDVHLTLNNGADMLTHLLCAKRNSRCSPLAVSDGPRVVPRSHSPTRRCSLQRHVRLCGLAQPAYEELNKFLANPRSVVARLRANSGQRGRRFAQDHQRCNSRCAEIVSRCRGEAMGHSHQGSRR
jgi:hypothetical protein